MGRSDGFSPRKFEDVRRSCRDRTVVYKSLGENEIGMSLHGILRAAHERRERELHEVLHQHAAGRYSTRSRSKWILDEEADEHSLEHYDVIASRSSRRALPSRGPHHFAEPTNGDDETSREGPTPSQTAGTSRGAAGSRRVHSPPRASRNGKRRRLLLVDGVDVSGNEEEEGESQPVNGIKGEENDDGAGDEDEEGLSMYERVKTRRCRQSSVDQRKECVDTSAVASPVAKRRSRRTGTPLVKEGEEDDEEEEEEEVNGPRQYPLRRDRKAVERYADLITQQKIASEQRRSARLSLVEERFSRNIGRRHEKRHRRLARSDSSSTGYDSDTGGRKDRRRGVDEEEMFDRRKEKSMAKARKRFLPINLSEKDLDSSHSLVRERLRQAGASCSDIDPMGMDSSVMFDQVGGLGPHIQTLKEVVLFPLLYPEVFTQFSISPPRGVVFYGPPGTGKTLIARALANECSKGARKVAFFMRKGADCLSKWVGESERQLRLLFDQAYAMRPSIIFFDEIDGLAPVRSSRQDQIHSSIVSTLLALMDGLDSRGEVVVIGATNRLDTLDPALRRPGRFDRELKFSLPDAAARLQILKIHTEKWKESKPPAETLQWLADSTSGFCGADLKFLCTEAVLIALRSRYPHIYMSSAKLLLDPSQLQISRQNLVDAMRKITPASRRDLTIPSRPLEPRTTLLLSRVLTSLLETRIPAGYRCSSSIESTASSDLEKVVRALESPPVVPAVRLLLCGNADHVDAGQSSFVLPALLSRLDHLPVFSLSVGKLFANGQPEEALAQTVQSALRAASTTPAILLLPNVDQWQAVVPPSVAHMLQTSLENLTGFTSLLLLATCDGELKQAPQGVRAIFREANAYQVPSPTESERRAFLDHIFQQATVPPKQFDASSYVCPPVATAEDVVPRKLSAAEVKELRKTYESQQRQFRIFLRDMLARLMRDRRFHIFNNPVDVEDAADYYEIIKEPMSMSEMMAKIDRGIYARPNEFLADIQLIMRNALEYNPDRNLEDRTIRHQAIGLRDMADALFDMELDEKFVEKMEGTARLLTEGGVSVGAEDIPFAKTPSREAVASSSVPLVPLSRASEPPLTSSEEQPNHETPCSSAIKRKKRFGKRRFGPKKSVNRAAKTMQHSSSAPNLETSPGGEEAEEEPAAESAAATEDDASRETAPDAMITEQLETERESGGDGQRSTTPEGESGKEKEGGEKHEQKEASKLSIDQKELGRVLEKILKQTTLFAVPELERLAAALLHAIELERDSFDRRQLPSRLEEIIDMWT